MILNRERDWLLRDKYGGRKSRKIEADVQRLDNGEPLAYVIGWVEFLGLKIDLRHRPLIPRPETEFWTELAVKRIGERNVRVLDIFTGSGCIGLAVLKHCPNAQVIFSDIDPNALKQVRLNARLNGIPASRYKIRESDCWRGINDKFDVILANPPYIPSARRCQLDASVVDFEPHLALFSGREGSAALKKFLRGLPARLKLGGWTMFECDSLAQLRSLPPLNKSMKLRFHKDQFGRYRFAEAYLTQ